MIAAAQASVFLDPSGQEVPSNTVLAKSAGLPTLLAFFKVTCPTCRLAWPYLQRLHILYGGRGVRVVGVSQNDATASKSFYIEFGATFDLLLDPEPAFSASNAWDVEAVPRLVLVSADGRVLRSFAGWSKKEMETLAKEIAEAKGLEVAPVVPPEDPVKDFQAG